MEEILNNGMDIKNKKGTYAIHVNNNDTTYIYIGSGNLQDRISSNLSKLRCNTHCSKQLQKAYNLFNNVQIEVLDIAETDELCRDNEENWIDYYKNICGCIVTNKNKPFCTKHKYTYKLTIDDVRDIKMIADKDNKLGLTRQEIAEIYNISLSHLSNILNGNRWEGVE